MSKPVDFDPSEWKEILPGIFSLKSDPQKLCFECVDVGEPVDPKAEEKVKTKISEVEEAKVEEGQE